MTKDDAVKHFGSQAALARACEVTDPAISMWEDGELTKDNRDRVQAAMWRRYSHLIKADKMEQLRAESLRSRRPRKKGEEND